MLLKSKKGDTLIEVMVAIALIGIIGMSFIAPFCSGIKFIAKARSSSAAGYNTQSTVETDLKTAPSSTSDVIPITFSDSPTIYASGTVTSKSTVVNGEQVNITYFMPRN